ncbi:RNA-dependent RNA polymerase family protein [Wolbachia endosymbiont of Tribolium confusum]|uniref:hypothetical protein n=1 Tax=Wolbachia endosymbiont of Tribolium confusum TaxID=214474 RepID=UPI001CF0F3C7|nr:hypothetical protein [Wolbachia endosymbiont of Tribolium confusum]MCA7010740.1 hypothetical protein [Wolbachia endosymbiont of Tribolium confusum]
MGTIQGGTILRYLPNVALHGLGQHIKEKLKEELFQFAKMKYGHLSYKMHKNNKHSTYADDFVILHEVKVVFEGKGLAGKWLKP